MQKLNIFQILLIPILIVSVFSDSSSAMLLDHIKTFKAVNIVSHEKRLIEKDLITWNQLCSCVSYYGVPHTCYYSPYMDPDRSCIEKCLREVNQ